MNLRVVNDKSQGLGVDIQGEPFRAGSFSSECETPAAACWAPATSRWVRPHLELLTPVHHADLQPEAERLIAS